MVAPLYFSASNLNNPTSIWRPEVRHIVGIPQNSNKCHSRKGKAVAQKTSSLRGKLATQAASRSRSPGRTDGFCDSARG
jgi:hypothetical protein